MEIKYCTCYLTVAGTSLDLLRFDREFEKSGAGYSISNLYPTPAGLDDNDAYLWRQNNWGTPWDVYANKCLISKQNDKFEYVFSIGFDAPAGAVTEVSKKYPALNFSMSYGIYTEEGKTRIANGLTVDID